MSSSLWTEAEDEIARQGVIDELPVWKVRKSLPSRTIGAVESRMCRIRSREFSHKKALRVRTISVDDVETLKVDNRICPKCSVRAVHHVGELDCGKWQAL